MPLESGQNSTAANDQSKQCRICLDDDNPNDIISPCLCSGGSAYVHRKCLNEWRSENAGGRGFKYCDVCKFEYIVESVLSDAKTERKRLLKYYFFVIRDSTAILLLIQIFIVVLAFLLKFMDRKSGNVKDLFPELVKGFMVYYLSAVILLLAIVGLITMIIFFCVSLSRNSPLSNCNMNGICGSVVAFIIVCALVGLIVGVVASVMLLRKLMKHHASQLWLRQEAEKYIIKDFQSRRNELEQYKKNSNTDKTTGS
ncbi:unnamed protein product [Rotaria magnacalcarata]|uniref:RING-CH-type domain-containing protein n=2 Tax=Rotaria magnacalcarata TaxID=392030 RepID=A0A819FZI3_9BILA|nr:unnamed protein product [Rotaria magnacalcarata]CAF2110034.1 unnamed protein product [Rotaria magnacalcarata]CAF2217593.1 unnamed protein product [Rotaria magnacalcarata]CAF2231114.1 unnamed protein product [Rotaria magnacalcarata]CAF3873810.1 unnamed protein product [Rotaria magnacalcarata]